MIRAVIFDVDGVLIDSFDANLKFFQDLMARCGYESPTRDAFRPLFSVPMRDVIRILTGLKSEQDVNAIWEIGQTIPAAVELIHAPSDIQDVIKTLNQDYLLGIATSRVRSGVYKIPQLAELKSYFRATVCYEDTIRHKPDPEPLLLAARMMNVENKECVYIGDAPSDMAAARAAHMKFILYHGYALHILDGADAHTDSFASLPRLVSLL